MRIFKIIMLFAYTVCGVGTLFAETTVYITKGQKDPVPVAINWFQHDSQQLNQAQRDIIHIVSNDLNGDGLFRVIPPTAYIDDKTGVSHMPLFAAWRQINALILLNGKIQRISPTQMEVSIAIYDIATEKKIYETTWHCPPERLRRVAHKISDQIYAHVIGEHGYFDTKIAYVLVDKTKGKKNQRLAVMDYDGANHYTFEYKQIIHGVCFSKNADKVLYASLDNYKSEVFIKDIYSGKTILLTDFANKAYAPKFSPDNKHVLFSIFEESGNVHIYELGVETRSLKKLTEGISINISASYSPDGTQILFNSDRGGNKQLYAMNRDGTNVRRISFGSGSYSTPEWSPKGDYIAFIKQNGDFYLGVMGPNGDSESLLTSGFVLDDVAWAPNGRKLIFTRTLPDKEGAKDKLYTINITGDNEREVVTPKDSRDASWSNILE